MKKNFVVSVIASMVALGMVHGNTLGEIKVTTATKTEKSIDGVTASIIVVTQEEIEKTGASTLDTILEKIPSINAQFARFPHPSSASKAAISLRGVGTNGTLILLDGKRLSGETESPYEMSRISASMIERIEIVKGSMSTLYGSDAIGGVINIITKKVSTNSTVMDIKYGSNTKGDAKNKNINFNTMSYNDDIRFKIYGSINDTTPYTLVKSYAQQATNPSTGANNDTHILDNISGAQEVTYLDESLVKNVGMRVEKDFGDDITFGLDINYFTENREGQYLGSARTTVGGLALIKNTPVSSEDRNRRLDISSDLNYVINEDLSLDTKVYRSYYKKRNYTNPLNFAGPTNTKFSANVTIDTIESNLQYALNENSFITTGMEYRKETRDSSAINPDPSSTAFITKEVDYSSLFIQDEIELSDTLHATLGARYDNISNASNKITFQAGLVKNLSVNTSFRVNYAQGYRAPDIAELYVVSPSYKDAKRFGAEVVYGPKTSAYDLKTEQSQSFEISLANNYDAFRSNITLFYNQIEDKIELVSYNDSNATTKYYTSENLDKVIVQGAEASLSYIFNDNFDVNFDATYLKTEDKSTNKKLTFTPDISFVLGANYKVSPEFSTSLMLRYIGEQYTNSTNTVKSDDYSLVDLSAKYKISKEIEIYGGIDNIFDKKVDELLGVNSGTYIYTGVRISF